MKRVPRASGNRPVLLDFAIFLATYQQILLQTQGCLIVQELSGPVCSAEPQNCSNTHSECKHWLQLPLVFSYGAGILQILLKSSSSTSQCSAKRGVWETKHNFRNTQHPFKHHRLDMILLLSTSKNFFPTPQNNLFLVSYSGSLCSSYVCSWTAGLKLSASQQAECSSLGFTALF